MCSQKRRTQSPPRHDELDELYEHVYAELRQLARAQVAREGPGYSLQPTALVHEVYVRLLRGDVASLARNRAYFFGAATQAMRRILVERARRRAAAKHGGSWQRVPFTGPTKEGEGAELEVAPLDDVLTVDRLLESLEQKDPAMARLVELRFFGGLTVAEVAVVEGTTERTVQRRWRAARAWLQKELAGD